MMRRTLLLMGASVMCGTAAAQTAVTTFHNDNNRSGWDATETALTYASVEKTKGKRLVQLWNIPLDEATFAQSLIVPNAVVAGDPHPGTHDVAYVSTYANTIYAIDPKRGTILLQRNLGAAALDACVKRGTAGINGTPVIDVATNTLYVITHINDASGTPQYVLHALDIGTLNDKVPPVNASGLAHLSDGTPYPFAAVSVRQRPAIVESNGAIYAAFGGSCDVVNPQAPGRGWVLGWATGTLAPLPLAELTDRDVTEPDNFFHTSIWMSGAGLAADSDGALYFTTGNSDPSGTTYSATNNITESAARLDPATGAVTSFTPENYSHLDAIDREFGSGGITVLPDIKDAPPMAVAAGKDGNMYLMNRDALGGYTPKPGPNNVLGTYQIGHCACAEGYFQADGTTYVVTSGGLNVEVWKYSNRPKPRLVLVGTSETLPNSDKGQGEFATITSNGSSDPIIWVATRPVPGSQVVNLYALQALPNAGSTTLPTLYSGPAGTWARYSNANITPVVANGRVYVSGDHELTIFGLMNPDKSSAKPLE